MLKNILKLEGAQQLSKKEQQSISGGGTVCYGGLPGVHCSNGYCCGYCTGPGNTCPKP
ncbi:MAG: hypothetical protein L3J09_00110 [Flavobacteriaceae bacterium]|nr:hypothetical protein [Flavobacteriaceae bacterium]